MPQIKPMNWFMIILMFASMILIILTSFNPMTSKNINQIKISKKNKSLKW
nr:ATP synthase F0 subunit 8 [Oribatula sakamorii]